MGILRRKPRKDSGQQQAISTQLGEALHRQHAAHPSRSGSFLASVEALGTAPVIRQSAALPGRARSAAAAPAAGRRAARIPPHQILRSGSSADSALVRPDRTSPRLPLAPIAYKQPTGDVLQDTRAPVGGGEGNRWAVRLISAHQGFRTLSEERSC